MVTTVEVVTDYENPTSNDPNSGIISCRKYRITTVDGEVTETMPCGRVFFESGDDVSNASDEVKAMAAIEHTPERIAKRKARIAKNFEAEVAMAEARLVGAKVSQKGEAADVKVRDDAKASHAKAVLAEAAAKAILAGA